MKVVDVDEEDDDDSAVVVAVVVVAVEPKMCVEDQPGSTVRRVPVPA